MRAYRFGWHGDNGVGEYLIHRILSGEKTATACPAYDPVEAEPGETLRLVDKQGRERGTLRITGREHRPFGEFDEALAAKLGMTLEELRHATSVANSREIRPSEPMRITYFEIVS